jgi:2-oxoglutarate ferredoxin oxidoreductase subunit gamma
MNMMKSIIFSGFGGQGIQFASRQLALAGMYSNKKVTWMPAYGPESRGGTSNCTVVIADTEIGSPIVAKPDILFAMSASAYRKFAPRVIPGGIIIGDSSLITEKIARDDITEYYIPATELAYANDMQRLANLIMVGKLLKITGLFTPGEVADALRKGDAKSDLVELNIKALNIGFTHE